MSTHRNMSGRVVWTAKDIGNLPEPYVEETMTRVPGVQVYRNGGETAAHPGVGSGLTIGGLSSKPEVFWLYSDCWSLESVGNLGFLITENVQPRFGSRKSSRVRGWARSIPRSP